MVKAEKELWSVCLLSCSLPRQDEFQKKFHEKVKGLFSFWPAVSHCLLMPGGGQRQGRRNGGGRLRSRSAWMLSLAVSFAT